MSTPTPPGSLPVSPTIPLPDPLRAAYEDLYDKLETQYQSTADPTVLEAVGPQRDNVKSILTKDDMYKLSQDTAIFKALLAQINATNDGLKTLQAQINATAAHFQTASSILGAVSNVFSLLGVV